MTSAKLVAPDISNALLDQMKYRADPLADATIANILGDWLPPPAVSASTSASVDKTQHAKTNHADADQAAAKLAEFASPWQTQWQRLAIVSSIFAQWSDNQSLISWHGQGAPAVADIPPDMVTALQAYVKAANGLPEWACHDKILRAEKIFTDYGVLSVTLLFCSSLPECYVIPDLAAVLNATGQLVDHAEYRVRATGAMIFPVMMKGGLTDPDGGGIAQVFKVRLIHATIRNLILRGNPEAALAVYTANKTLLNAGVIAPMAALGQSQDMHQILFAHGWRLDESGLPCNQEELAYTLLTFSYVFLRSMRKLGLGLPGEDEEAYLHAWNVMAYFLGIEKALMPATMAEAEAMFTLMQARGRQDQAAGQHGHSNQLDPRPALGRALMDAMKSAIPFRIFKPFPVMLTRYLCGSATAKELGLNGWISPLSRLLFTGLMLLIRLIDSTVRLVSPGFSISRLLTRIFGYRFICKLLMDQTRPLKIPLGVRQSAMTTMAGWGHDTKASKWINSLEDMFTNHGDWQQPTKK